MSLCNSCVSGVRHEGTPEGKIEIINGIKTYVATPSVDYPKHKAVLFLPDGFGIELVNNQLLADDFARNGFKVYAIDYYDGDPIPADAFDSAKPKFDSDAWLRRHTQAVTRPFLDRVITALKEQDVTEFAATGYCFGGRYIFDLAFEHVIKVAAVSHPSLLNIPQDLRTFKDTGVPLLINSCEFDPLFPIDAQTQADEILGGGTQISDLYRREYFPGCMHGFAVRGDLSKPEVKAGKEGSFKATVEFLLKHFGL